MSQITEKASHTKKLNQVQYFGLASCRLWRNVTKARKIGLLKIASFEWGRHTRKPRRYVVSELSETTYFFVKNGSRELLRALFQKN